MSVDEEPQDYDISGISARKVDYIWRTSAL